VTEETITLVRIEGGGGYPSQWEAEDEAGRYYYLRYRHGYGTIKRAENADAYDVAEWDSESGRWIGIETLATFEHGDEWDGWIELDEFCRLAGIRIELHDSAPEVSSGAPDVASVV